MKFAHAGLALALAAAFNSAQPEAASGSTRVAIDVDGVSGQNAAGIAEVDDQDPLRWLSPAWFDGPTLMAMRQALIANKCVC